MASPAPSGDDGLIRRRDALLSSLRRQGFAGVLSAGVSRQDGAPGLTVLVRPGFEGHIPETFEGLPVAVTRSSTARGF